MTKIIVKLVEFIFYRFVNLMYETNVKVNTTKLKALAKLTAILI